jgi:hypothetical protein
LNHQDTKGTKNDKMSFENIGSELDKIATEVVDAAYKIHKHFGPGLLESAYEACLFVSYKNEVLRLNVKLKCH